MKPNFEWNVSKKKTTKRQREFSTCIHSSIWKTMWNQSDKKKAEETMQSMNFLIYLISFDNLYSFGAAMIRVYNVVCCLESSHCRSSLLSPLSLCCCRELWAGLNMHFGLWFSLIGTQTFTLETQLPTIYENDSIWTIACDSYLWYFCSFGLNVW